MLWFVLHVFPSCLELIESFVVGLVGFVLSIKCLVSKKKKKSIYHWRSHTKLNVQKKVLLRKKHAKKKTIKANLVGKKGKKNIYLKEKLDFKKD